MADTNENTYFGSDYIESYQYSADSVDPSSSAAFSITLTSGKVITCGNLDSATLIDSSEWTKGTCKPILIGVASATTSNDPAYLIKFEPYIISSGAFTTDQLTTLTTPPPVSYDLVKS